MNQLTLILIFILATIIFIWSIIYQKKWTRCHSDKPNSRCFDGNGYYHYKGRGNDNESVQTLLQRIRWSAKNGNNKFIYHLSYIIAYLITIVIFVVLYTQTKYIPTATIFIVILLASFLIIFSVGNLFGFHTDRYPYFYISENVKRVQAKLNLSGYEPPEPDCKSVIPHRTIVGDILSS